MVERNRKPENFPTTRSSILWGLKSADAAAKARSIERLAEAYWKPVYKYLRYRWRKTPTEAEDITQAFFLRAIDKDTFASYDPAQARFRTFIRVCLDRFTVDGQRREMTHRRGGGVRLLPLDFSGAEGEIAGDQALASDPERLFEIEWVRSVLSISIESLRTVCASRGKDVYFRIFEMFHLGDEVPRPTYAQAATELGLSVTDITNRLAYVRREFRAVVLDTLGELTGSDEELRAEARAVLKFPA